MIPYRHQNHLIFMNEPNKMKRWLDALNMSLARMYAMPINFYLGFLKGEACHISGGASTHIWEIQYVQLIPKLTKPFLIQWLGEYIGKLIFGAYTLNANVPFCWWSLMKWWRTSMCFVLACWTGLLVNLIALSLSHCNGTLLNLITKSLKVAFI